MYVIHYWSRYTEWFCPARGACPVIYNTSTLFWHSEDCAAWYILIIKANKMHYFSYFDKELYMFRTDLLSIISSLSTVYTAIGICHASYVDCLVARSEWNSVPSWPRKNPASEIWWVHLWTLSVTAPNCKCCWNYTSAGTTYIYLGGGFFNENKFQFVVMWHITAGKNHHPLFTSFIVRSWIFFMFLINML